MDSYLLCHVKADHSKWLPCDIKMGSCHAHLILQQAIPVPCAF